MSFHMSGPAIRNKSIVHVLKRSYAQGVMFDEESILGIYFGIFKETRLYFGTTISKMELRKPLDQRKKTSLHVLPAVLQGIHSGVLSRRQDVTPNFRRECPTTQHINMTRTWDEQVGQQHQNRPNSMQNNLTRSPSASGDRESRRTNQLRFVMPGRIRQAIPFCRESKARSTCPLY